MMHAIQARSNSQELESWDISIGHQPFHLQFYYSCKTKSGLVSLALRMITFVEGYVIVGLIGAAKSLYWRLYSGFYRMDS